MYKHTDWSRSNESKAVCDNCGKRNPNELAKCAGCGVLLTTSPASPTARRRDNNMLPRPARTPPHFMPRNAPGADSALAGAHAGANAVAREAADQAADAADRKARMLASTARNFGQYPER